MKQELKILDAELDMNTDTTSGFNIVINNKNETINEHYQTEFMNFDKECELYAPFPKIAFHTSNYVEKSNENCIYVIGGKNNESLDNSTKTGESTILKIDVDTNKWKNITNKITLTDPNVIMTINMNELYNDVSNGSHTTTNMNMNISVIDKSYLYTLINNNLYEFDYENDVIKKYIIGTDINLIDLHGTEINSHFDIKNHTTTRISNKQNTENWTFDGLLIAENDDISNNLYILDFNLNIQGKIEYTLKRISTDNDDGIQIIPDSQSQFKFKNHKAIYVNDPYDLKEPYGKIIFIGGENGSTTNDVISILNLSNIEKEDTDIDISYNKIWKSTYNIVSNSMYPNDFSFSIYHDVCLDDDNNIWLIGGNNNIIDDIQNDDNATLTTQKLFVNTYRQPSKVPLIDEVLIIDLSYNASRNDIEEKDVIIKYKPQKPPKLAGFAITWTSVNFSEALKNIPQWATNDYLGNYKALSQYWCKKWNNNNYFHFNDEFIPTLYIENNESEMFLNKIYLNFDKCKPNKNNADTKGQDLSFIRMSDILEATSAAMRQSNLKGKKGEPNFADGQPGPNGKDKDFNIYNLEDVRKTLNTYIKATSFNIEEHNKGNKNPFYNAIISGGEWVNNYREWDEIEELIKIYLIEYEKENIPDEEPTSYYSYYYYLRDKWEIYVKDNLWPYWWKNPNEIKQLTDTGMDKEEATRRTHGEERYISPIHLGEKGDKGIRGAQGITDMVYGKDTVKKLTNINVEEEDSPDYPGFNKIDILICNNIRIPSNLYVRGTEKTETTEKGGVFLLSDARLKKDIENINTDKAIRIIENLEPVAYSIMDRTSLTYFPEYGYIAQDVKKHFPQAVTENNRNVVENVGRFSEKNIWEGFENENGEIQYKLTVDLSENEIPDEEDKKEYKLICIKILDENMTDEVHKNNIEKLKTIDYNKDNSEILDNYIVDELDLTLLEDNRSFIVDKKYDEIYIYGYKVSDFHVLDKDKIFTLHHTVLKKLHEESVKLEVMNEKSLEIQEIQHMKAETTNIRKKLEDMKKMINNLMI